MPGTPGPRLTGGDPHASDARAAGYRDTPYNGAANLPMTATTTLGHIAGLSVLAPTLNVRDNYGAQPASGPPEDGE